MIIRTASEGVKEDDIRNDVTRLQERWKQIEAKAIEIKEKAAGAAVALYEEPDVLVKVIRDLFNEDFAGLVVSGDEAWNTINEYVNSVAPDLVSKLSKYEPPAGPDGSSGPDVFAVHRIDEQLAKAMDRKVWLPSGGTLVIDRTEAMTVVDVNTGKFTGSGGTSSRRSPRTTSRRPRRSCANCGCATSAASSSSTSSTWCWNPTAIWCCAGSPRRWPVTAPAIRCPR